MSNNSIPLLNLLLVRPGNSACYLKINGSYLIPLCPEVACIRAYLIHSGRFYAGTSDIILHSYMLFGVHIHWQEQRMLLPFGFLALAMAR